MSKLTKSFKGQIKEARDKAIWIDVVADELFSTWVPKSALDMTKTAENYLTVTGMQTFHVKQWFLDMKAKEADTKAQFMEKADEISTTPAPKEEKIPRIPDMIYDKKVKTQTVIIPAQPTDKRPYFPNMSIFELRDYHLRENNGAIRGHIENIIMMKELTKRVHDLLNVIIELMEERKLKEGKK